MMYRASFLLAALAGLSLTSAACAQAPEPEQAATPDFSFVDPTAPDAVVEYGGPDPVIIETVNGPVTFITEIANTDASRARGMMHRETMGADEGMLLDFQEERVASIWMANTLVGLDILYIRADGTIAKIVANAVPRSRRPMWSDEPVVAVLEIPAGRSAELSIAPGDLVRHALFGTAEAPSEPETAAEDSEDEPVETDESSSDEPEDDSDAG